ncbi:MAG TPA: cation diffusion facilitator family transporter [Ignavibacteriaceae bacterium]|nr:cation diffusion facilitator family transporter [Ignavibacteriaceae bacterium]
MKKPVAQSNLLKQKEIVTVNLLIDVITALPVIIIAILSNSLALATDIFDYTFTITSSSISLIILKRCIKNERGNFDFGLGKFESLSALFTSVLMLSGIIFLSYKAIVRVVDTVQLETTFVIIGMIIQTIGFFINLSLWSHSLKQSKTAVSPIMEAQWRVNRINAFGNLIVILSLSLGLIFREYTWAHKIDPAAAIILIFITAKSFIGLIRNSLNDLLDHTLDEDLQLKILKRLAEFEDSYERFYDFRSRKSGSKIFIDISLGFDPVRNVGDCLDFSGRIKERLETDIPNSEVNIIIRFFEDFDETLINVDLPGEVLPLSEEHLDECLDIAAVAFPNDDIELIKLELNASIHPTRYKKELQKLGIQKPRYWVGILDGKIAGFVGMNYHIGEPDIVWGGWMAARAPNTKSDMKIRMLFMWKLTFEARQTGRTFGRLYTSTHPNEKAANRLYDNVGMRVYKSVPKDDYDLLYREVVIQDAYERVRPGKKRHYKSHKPLN